MKDNYLKYGKILYSVLYALYFVSVITVHIFLEPAQNGLTQQYGIWGAAITYFLSVALVVGFFALCTAIQAAVFHSKASTGAKAATAIIFEFLKTAYSCIYFVLIDGRNVIFHANADVTRSLFVIVEITLFALTVITEITLITIICIKKKTQ